jgi:colanic acid/amylovoran biosynthesis glycosyltransferase
VTSPPDAHRPAVAHVTGGFLPRTEGWIYDQIRFATSVRGVVLARSRHHRESFPWEPVYVAPHGLRGLRDRMGRALLGAAPAFRRAAEAEGVRLVHAHFGRRGVKSLGLARALRAPLVTSFYGVDLWQERREGGLARRYRRLFAEGAAFVAEGPVARRRLIELGAPSGRTHLHRLGVEVEAIPFQPRPTGRGFRVLMAARFTEKKGMEYGVEAFCRVARSRSEVELTVVGGATDRAGRAIESRLRSIVAAAGVAERVHFPGFLPREAVRELAATHHLLLHPSVTAADGDREGGHPVILTEMAAAGMPAVGTVHCDIPEIVVDGETGWLVPERDVDCIARALEEALESPERLALLGRGARRRAEEHYDARCHTLDSLYQSLLP